MKSSLAHAHFEMSIVVMENPASNPSSCFYVVSGIIGAMTDTNTIDDKCTSYITALIGASAVMIYAVM